MLRWARTSRARELRYYSRVHGQIHLVAQFTSGVLWHFQNSSWKAGFLVLKRPKMRPPPVIITPKLKVWEVSQGGFWNISSHSTSVPSFSQIGWQQLLAPGPLSQTMTLKMMLFGFPLKHYVRVTRVCSNCDKATSQSQSKTEKSVIFINNLQSLHYRQQPGPLRHCLMM